MPHRTGCGVSPRDREVVKSTAFLPLTASPLTPLIRVGFSQWTAAAIRSSPGRASSRLDNNFFRVRFDRLTPLEQKYLPAMAELGPGPCATGQIAEALGVQTASVATVRQRLIHKGLVWSQRHGKTSFTVPMFDGFMKRQMPELLRHVPQPRSGS